MASGSFCPVVAAGMARLSLPAMLAANCLVERVPGAAKESGRSQEIDMTERVGRWFCTHFHKGVIWKQDGYECPVCFRHYPVPWDGDYYIRYRKPERSGIDRFFAQRFLQRLEVEMVTSLEDGDGRAGSWEHARSMQLTRNGEM